MFHPFQAPAKPFIIGLAPVNADAFILLDEARQEFRTQKEALYRDQATDVSRARGDTVPAQREAALLLEHTLLRQFPTLFERKDNLFIDSENGAKTSNAASSASPLDDVALHLQDDLLLMRKHEDGWRLVAASLCFPSSWNLHEKFDKPLEAIHGPVPMDNKMHQRIRRIFDAMRPGEPLWRENWGISTDGGLRHARAENEVLDSAEDLSKPLHLRVEYQTLHKLPESGDILFTVGVRMKSFQDLAASDHGRGGLRTVLDHYRAMPEAQRVYKGLAHNRKVLIHSFDTALER
ncbi:MAG: DUF3445 domain-containing protein [Pseudomonadota bacterium]